MANGVGQQRGVSQDVVDTSKINELMRVNPRVHIIEDSENFVKDLQKVFEFMRVVDAEHVELVSYQLKGVARIWYDQLKKCRDKGAPLMSCLIFESAFL